MCHKIIIFNKNNYRDSRTLESITQQLMQPIALQYTTDFIAMQPIAIKNTTGCINQNLYVPSRKIRN